MSWSRTADNYSEVPKAVMYDKQPKMKRDTQQKISLFSSENGLYMADK